MLVKIKKRNLFFLLQEHRWTSERTPVRYFFKAIFRGIKFNSRAINRRTIRQRMSSFVSTKTYLSNFRQIFSRGSRGTIFFSELCPKENICRKLSNHYHEIHPKIFKFYLRGISVPLHFAPGTCQKFWLNGSYLGNSESTILGFSREFCTRLPLHFTIFPALYSGILVGWQAPIVHCQIT